ncbi:thioesterase II family protein [Kitasatospora sp. NPDC096204]|uniref:thioesterase II family protein n=1 Tax=Kitasatospora sp. NPDC096204 TaxID=3364094 RepID=UPI00381C2887
MTAAPGAFAPPGRLGPGRSPYLLPRQPDPGDAPLRLICFHHAGGMASSFSTWQQQLGAEVAVVPVQLPGREHRVREARLHDFDRLLDELDEALDPLLDEPHAFYGHSMGGQVAFELTRRRRARGRELPERLLLGAAPPPHTPRQEIEPAMRTDEELTNWMAGLGGIPELVRAYPEWLAHAVTLLRDDLRLALSRVDRGQPPVPVPVSVLVGSGDPLIGAALAQEWARHTTADCRVFTLPGGHFFHRDSPAATLALIRSLLAPAPAVRA